MNHHRSLVQGGLRRTQAGFGLIEVLVAVFVLAVGLLGMAAMQASSLRLGGSAQWRSQAVMMTHDMMERVRANQRIATVVAPAALAVYSSPMAGVVCNRDFSPSASASVAVNDLNEWRNNLACSLSDGHGSVNVNAGIVTIVVQWDDSRGAEAPQQFSFSSRIWTPVP